MKTSKQEIGTKPFRVYYDTRLIHENDIRESIIRTTASWSHTTLLEQRYVKDNTIKWRCYTCHNSISIDYKTFTLKDMFCDEHKPKHLTNKYKQDTILLRYVNSLFDSIRNRISKNSKIKLYE